MYQRAVAFEKQHGDRAGIEDVIVGERRFQYEEEVAKNPRNYDTWFDYCRLEENAGDPDKIREVGALAGAAWTDTVLSLPALGPFSVRCFFCGAVPRQETEEAIRGACACSLPYHLGPCVSAQPGEGGVQLLFYVLAPSIARF